MKSLVLLFLHPRNLLVYLLDVAIACAALVLGYYLRIGQSIINNVEVVLQAATTFTAVAAVVFAASGLYRHAWAYVSLRDAVVILKAATFTVLVFIPIMFLFTRLELVPRSLPFISWFTLVFFLAAPRFIYRMLRDGRFSLLLRSADRHIPLLVIGTGDEADHFVRATQSQPDSPYQVLGLVTSAPARVGQVIQGIEVLGLDTDLERLVSVLDAEGRRPQRLVLTNRVIGGEKVQRLLAVAEKVGCPLSRLPAPTDVHDYDGIGLRPRPIAIEDLLGRPQTRLDRTVMESKIRDGRVLITGAGGSIGSELVRQVSECGPAHVCLVDHSEFHLYSIDLEARNRFPNVSFSASLADVRDIKRLDEVFGVERPQLVFHAAALKQVPMVEANIIEGVLTNAIGTKLVADACLVHGVEAMTFISTDKAVNPANIMGASKRLGEMYCQTLDLGRHGTRFVTLRFGNVLGSAGSVVPLFQKQLEGGGPLTVTHPDVERYFMTVQEAVELVLQAMALGSSKNDDGAIYVLDMGKPVKIVDLAQQMIRLAGKVPYRDVDIKITGLRSGEKLTEEVFHGEESLVGTDMAGILLARPRAAELEFITDRLGQVETASRNRDEKAVLALLAELVPELRRASGESLGELEKTHLKIVK